jgi:transcriptional regulator with XRE-family HTH domain
LRNNYLQRNDMIAQLTELLALSKSRWVTPTAICNNVGIDRVTLWRLEQGLSKPRAKTIGKFVNALNADDDNA